MRMMPMVELHSAEADLIDRLRGGDEAAFVCLVNTYSASLKRLALAFVPIEAVAEEVVQETWLAVLTGIARFEGRSSVKTWIFKILANRAKTRAIRERRTINFSELDDPFELDRLPASQRVVVALRDVQGWPAAEVCEVLGLSEGNQRVLLHRGRSRLRGVLENYFKDNA